MRLQSLCPAIVTVLLFLAGCSSGTDPRHAATPAPPRATVEPTELRIHGDVRVDDYYWLKERENPEVVAYLEAENTYVDAVLGHTAGLQETLFNEIVGRIKQDDQSVPYRDREHYYYWRYPAGGEYKIHARRKGSLEAPEQVMLDGNLLAEGHEFFALRGIQVSPDQNLLAYAVDTVGRRKYTLRFRDLTSGKDLPDTIPLVTGNGVWANDNRSFFYTHQDPDTLRWHRIYKHVLGADPATDVLVYEEPDEEFSSYVVKTKSRRYLLIVSEQTLSSEVRYLDADQPDGEPQVFQPREADHEYSLDHFQDRFLVRTNWQAKNFRLMQAPIGPADKQNWTELVPHREQVYLEDFRIFNDHLVLEERREGLIRMRVRPWDGSEPHDLDFGEPAYLAYFSDNPEMNTPVLRFGYTSLTTPNSIFDYDMNSRTRTLLKEEAVLGGFDKANYRTERLHAATADGAQVPISLVYRPDLFRGDGSNPLLIYGYGSYGVSIDPAFRSGHLSLLDRGFVFAVAHTRGGQELGRAWYEGGKLLNKKNTFTDFIDASRFLIERGYTRADRLFAMGGSAGGLLMGAVANMAPELYQGIVSRVPFVDVVTTMLDADIPLTTSEYDEWGNPNDKPYYDYMLSYSPYDQIEAKAYPNILVTAGLHDSQVQYWEPAKYVAKLRAIKTDANLLLLRTEMGAGHGGASGRFKRYRETALTYAFLLELAGRQ